MNQLDPKTHQLEHSEAKLRLYNTYLSKYLNILARNPYVDTVFLFDLLCGEGILEDNAKGSPIIALETIRDHYLAGQPSVHNMAVWFSDNGQSEIEPAVTKIERVERFGKAIKLPATVSVEYCAEDYKLLYPRAVSLVNRTCRAKGLFFIDPYGYKDIRPEDIQRMLVGNNTEVLLWLPISFMYRFANAVTQSDFKGVEPLREFLGELFGADLPRFTSVYDFIEQITHKFRDYLRDLRIFVDYFMLQRRGGNVYCLFFFTSHIKGYETMLATKWHMDENRGKGHTLDKAPAFSEVQLSCYPRTLEAFIAGAEYRTNDAVYKFGLENGFLPKHTVEILREWKKQGLLEVLSLDGCPVKGFYLSYNSGRRVGINLKVPKT